jgi:hypothetical protein
MDSFAAERPRAGSNGGDSMSDIIQTERFGPSPSIAPVDVPSLSDDECLARLAGAVEAQDSRRLEEVAQLIGRLAVTIE